MFTSENFAAVIAGAVSQLQAAQKALQQLTYPDTTSLTVNLRELSEERIGKLLESVPMGYAKHEKGVDFVYVIQVNTEQSNLLSTLSRQLNEARRTANDYSRLNSENPESKTLYVGRSKTLRARLKQHLGTEGHGTYSLHLQRWATGNDIDITIFVMKFSEAEDLLVQAVEDSLWASLKPAFGRKGER